MTTPSVTLKKAVRNPLTWVDQGCLVERTVLKPDLKCANRPCGGPGPIQSAAGQPWGARQRVHHALVGGWWFIP